MPAAVKLDVVFGRNSHATAAAANGDRVRRAQRWRQDLIRSQFLPLSPQQQRHAPTTWVLVLLHTRDAHIQYVKGSCLAAAGRLPPPLTSSLQNKNAKKKRPSRRCLRTCPATHTCERRLSSVVASFSTSCIPSTTTRRPTPALVSADR